MVFTMLLKTESMQNGYLNSSIFVITTRIFITAVVIVSDTYSFVNM